MNIPITHPSTVPTLDTTPTELHPTPITPDSPPNFPRRTGETPGAYSAFVAYFQLGHGRSLYLLADKLGVSIDTLKKWSTKHDWCERLQAFYSGLLEKQAADQLVLQRQSASLWADRLNQLREKEWDTAQKLLLASQCFLESFSDEERSKMSLPQAARALQVSSMIGRLALVGAELPCSAPVPVSPVQQQLLDALERVYGQARPDGQPSESLPTTGEQPT
jgi:hypothetical protein